MSRPCVLYWDNIPAPYAVERYNTVADRGNVDLSVWFARRTDPDRSWEVDEKSWRFRGRYVEDPSRGLGAIDRFNKRLDELRPDLILSLYGEAPFVAGHPLLKGRGIPTALVVHPTYDAWIRRAAWKESLKSVLFRSADAAKVPGPDGLAYARRYGFPDDRVFRVRQTIDVERYARGLPERQRTELRARAGVSGCVFLHVGRLWTGKGLLVLIDAFREARRQRTDISLLIVGDGPDEEQIRRAAAGIEGIVFTGFVSAGDLPTYYASADVLVFPTLGDPNGLVVEEAHAAGLPVLSSDAAGDIRLRVIDGETGFVCPVGDARAMAARMIELAADPALRMAMGAKGQERVRTFSHEYWAEDFEEFVAGTLALPPRDTAAATAMTVLGTTMIASADFVARTRTFFGKIRRTGFRAIAATARARLNRAGMWLACVPWRLTRPRLRLVKFGTRHGGWILPVDLLASGGVCYLAGVGDDVSIEMELLRRTTCTIRSFDPTPQSIAFVASQNLDPLRSTFHPVGLSDKTETARFFSYPALAFETYSQVNLWGTEETAFDARCTTVRALMAELGDEQLVLLKLSIEGAEWRVLDDVLRNGPRPAILCVVFCQPAAFWRIARMIRTLGRAGYRALCREEWKFTFVDGTRL